MKFAFSLAFCSLGMASANIGVVGGTSNTAEGQGAVVLGGLNNVAGQDFSAAGGGNKNKVNVHLTAAFQCLVHG